jgi:hypothetical protein
MLPGFSGHLISECLLERELEARQSSVKVGPVRRHLLEWRCRTQSLGPASSLRGLYDAAAEPLLAALGLGPPTDVVIRKDMIAASVAIAATPLALLVAPWGARLDAFWRPAVVEAARRGAGWCLIFNGTQVRMLSASRLYSRRYVEFDLAVALDDDRTCGALATVLVDPHRLVVESDRETSAVSRSLRDGVLDAAAHVLGALMSAPPRPLVDRAFEQALTIVYRILFLLFAEARHLVPLWHPVYRESYSLDALRASIERGDHSAGLWDTLRAVSRLAHGGCRAGDLRVTPFNGRLFAPARTPLAERRNLDDEAVRRALVALATRPTADRVAREPIAYRDLGVEQLGAVYETLLDYAPRVESATPKTRAPVVSLHRGSGLRKATGTFYTPQPLAHFLVRRTLTPLVADRTPDEILRLKVVDPAMGSGAFLVAACQYLAQAYEDALLRTSACHASDLGPRELVSIRRTIAERCLYGVDLNPMAVQLARLSLWLATLAADRPLSFLDHHLQCGDSLLGAWIAGLSRAPAPHRRAKRRDELPLIDEAMVGAALCHALPIRFSLASEPNDTLEQVRRKERALEAVNRADTPLSKWRRIADLWCTAWFAPDDAIPVSAFGALTDAVLDGGSALPRSTVQRYLERLQAIAAPRRFFHWELEFPEVFFDPQGRRLPLAGFDAVIGNPPWDMIRADSGSGGERSEARRDTSAIVRFTRDSGVYSNQSVGHANRYQLFVERGLALARRGGRLGLVLPSGIASDHGSAPLRRLLFSRAAVDALVGFDNRDGVFPIHRSVRFLLLTATSGSETTSISCRLGERNPAVLETDGDEADPDAFFRVSVTPALLQRLSGDDLALPDLRRPADLAIAERVAALFPALGDERGWFARFGRELNVTDDRKYFSATASGLPVVEGKHVEPFRANVAATRWSIGARDADRLLGRRHRQPRVCYRDVASATNRMTLIAAVLPPGCVSTHTLFCLRTPMPLRSQYFLCGVFNSFVVNYLVRLRVTTHVTTAIVERLPIPTADEALTAFHEIAALARLRGRRASPEASARLNALVARLYQLSSEEFEYVLGTFPLVPRDERDAAFREFQALGNRLVWER